MAAADVSDRVRQIIAEHLAAEIAQLTDDANLVDDLGADSLDTVELRSAFEEEFSVVIDDNDAEGVTTVGQAVAVIRKLTGGAHVA